MPHYSRVAAQPACATTPCCRTGRLLASSLRVRPCIRFALFSPPIRCGEARECAWACLARRGGLAPGSRCQRCSTTHEVLRLFRHRAPSKPGAHGWLSTGGNHLRPCAIPDHGGRGERERTVLLLLPPPITLASTRPCVCLCVRHTATRVLFVCVCVCVCVCVWCLLPQPQPLPRLKREPPTRFPLVKERPARCASP